jgi:hypothetical protein
MLKTKYMKHYASHKTMNLQSMHILLQNILKTSTVDSNYRNTILTMSIRNHSHNPSEGEGVLRRRSLPR